jgi:glycosyltransferase involved in cell wall biosynthesis
VKAFSIILPVRNGGEYIKECVNSILSQTVEYFNLIILDSGSTDGTIEWVNTLTDSRIVFYPSDTPLSIEQNWARIKSIPRNEWMTIIGHDDIMHRNYLEVIAQLIDKYPDASLYATHFDFIDSKGKVIKTSKPMEPVQSAERFLEKTLKNEIDAVGLMMRSKDYDAVGGIPLYPNLLFSDYALWIEMTRISYKATAPEHCQSYRLHQTSTTRISNEEQSFKAYDEYIKYLIALKRIDPALNSIINQYVKYLLNIRCIEFSKKLLKTDKKNRTIFKSVSALVQKHKKYAYDLIDDHSYNPGSIPKVVLARLIDSNLISRKALYLLSNLF